MSILNKCVVFVLSAVIVMMLSGCLGPLYGIYELTKEEPQEKAAPVYAAPVVTVDSISGGRVVDPSAVPIDFNLSDSDAHPCDMTVSFKVGAGAWTACTVSDITGSLTGLSAPPGGQDHSLTWDATNDLSAELPLAQLVDIQVVADDPLHTSVAKTTGPFDCGNNIPSATITTPATDITLNGVIEYFLIDDLSDECSINVFYSTDSGGSWDPATIVSGETSNLTAGPAAGVRHDFVWDSLADVGAVVLGTVQLRVEPTDSQLGTEGDTTNFVVSNASAVPLVAIQQVDRALGTLPHEISYKLYDTDSAPCSITMEYSLASGGAGTWVTATMVGTTSALPSSPLGIGHTIEWDFDNDGLSGSFQNDCVVIRITPDDGSGGFWGDSNTFTLGNEIPSATIVQPAGDQAGNVVIDYRLIDSTSDPCDIDIYYSPASGAGGTWSLATIVSGDQTALTSAATPGDLHDFVWNSLADIGAAVNTTVQLRVVPADSEPGTGGDTTDFTVNNQSELPIANVDTVARALEAVSPHVISYVLYDSASDACDVELWYSLNGAGGPWVQGAVSGTEDGDTGLISSPTGEAHTIGWDFVTDLVSGFYDDTVMVRIIPDDGDAGISGDSNLFTFGNEAPSATMVQPVGEQSGNVVVQYRLIDSSSDACDIDIYYSPASGAGGTWVLADIVSGDQTALTSAATPGDLHDFVWNSVGDIGATINSTVRLRVVPADSDPGTGGDTVDFTVNNQGELSIVNVGTVDRALEGVNPHVISYVLYDSASDACDVELWYSLNGAGGPWVQGTVSGTEDGDTGLTSSPTGVAHTIGWDFVTDLVSGFYDNTVMARIIPDDGTVGIAGDSNLFTFGNEIPSATVVQPVGAQSGNVVIQYRLIDSTSDDCDIDIYFSPSSGGAGTWSLASIVSGDQNALTSVVTPGELHDFVWDSLADVGATLNTTVRLRVVPADSDPGTAGDTADFTVNNQSELPIANVDTVGRALESVDPHVFSYVLYDSASDACDVELWYSLTGAGGPWIQGAVSGTEDGDTGLTSSPTGIAHTIGWDFVTDLVSGFYNGTVAVRIVPKDPDTGIAGDSNLFTFGNQVPSATVVQPSGEQSGNIVIEYNLIDSTSDLCSVAVAYSTNGTVYNPASIVSGEISNLSSSPGAGTVHTLTWNSKAHAELDDERVTTVTVRITPTDSEAGTFGTTADFIVNNNAAPSVTFLASQTTYSDEYGIISIPYRIYDPEEDSCSITLTCSIDGEAAQVCTEYPAKGSEGLTGLTSYVNGGEENQGTHLFLWNSFADGGWRDGFVDLTVQVTDINGNSSVEVLKAMQLFNYSTNWLQDDVRLTTAVGPRHLATGDINGDGYVDVVSADGDDNVSVIYGSSAGHRDAESLPVGSYPYGVALGDLNGDGFDDIACANHDSDNISVSYGNGSGHGIAGAIAAGSQPYSIAIGDLNDDGYGDIVCANFASDSITVSLGSGAGHMPPTDFQAFVPADMAGPYSITTAYINDDNYADIVCVNYNSDTITVSYGNNGVLGYDDTPDIIDDPGGTTNLPRFVTSGDLNGDGFDEVVCAWGGSADNITVLYGGAGGYQLPIQIFTAGNFPYSATINDFNGDGYGDIGIVNRNSNNITVSYGSSTGHTLPVTTFAAGGNLCWSIGAGDLDGDGYADIVTANWISDSISVSLGSPAGCDITPTVIPDPDLASSQRPYWVEIADLNGDGLGDIICARNISDDIVVYYGSAMGHHALESVRDTGTDDPAAVAAGDINGDGYQDMVCANYGSNDCLIQYGSKTGSNAVQTQASTGSDPRDVVLADLDNDGFDDIVIANGTTKNLTISYGSASGHDTTPDTVSDASFDMPIALGAGYFNDDSFADVICANYNAETFAVVYGDAGRTHAVTVVTDTGISQSYAIAVGRIDADGYDDVVCVNVGSDDISILFGSAAGLQVPERVPMGVDSEPRAVAIADIGKDANADIVVANAGTDNIGLLFGDGTQNPVAPIFIAVGNGPESVAAGDLDGDGWADIAVANRYEDTMTIIQGQAGVPYYQTPQILASGQRPGPVKMADLNGDAYADIVCVNLIDGNVMLVYGHSSGHQPAAFLNTGADPVDVGIGDLNGDGMDDFMIANSFGDDAAIVYGRANGLVHRGLHFNILTTAAVYTVNNMALEFTGGEFVADQPASFRIASRPIDLPASAALFTLPSRPIPASLPWRLMDFDIQLDAGSAAMTIPLLPNIKGERMKWAQFRLYRHHWGLDRFDPRDDVYEPHAITPGTLTRDAAARTVTTIGAGNITAFGTYQVFQVTDDTDGDGLPDAWEASYGLTAAGGNPDADGLDNLGEYQNNCDPNDSDTDNDTFTDGVEVGAGTDPNDPNDHP
ncbi:FG-GAP-like repeat-containing protein [Planctomycetota bacterium]